MSPTGVTGNVADKQVLDAFAYTREKHLLALFRLPSIRPSVRIYQLGSPCTDFREIWYWELLLKSVKNLDLFKIGKKNVGHLTCRPK